MDVFAAAKPFLNVATISEMNRANKEDTGKGKETRLTAEDSEVELEPDVTLSKPDSTQPAQIKFPAEMFLTVHHKHIFPLAFFTPDNISYINLNLHKFKRMQLVDEKKTYVLDIEDMEKKIKEAGTGPSRDDDEMTILDWWQAYDIYYSFEASRYISWENLPRALFFQSHFNFFVSQEHTADLFPIWRTYEADRRRQHYECDPEFVEAKYDNMWLEIKSIAKVSTKPTAPPPKQSSLTKNHFTPSNHSSSSSSNLPFQASNKDKAPAPRCVGCSRRGHKLGDKNAEHGRFPFSTYSGSELRAREGGGKICIIFNCFGSCNKNCHPSTHICSLCGGTHSSREYHHSCIRID